MEVGSFTKKEKPPPPGYSQYGDYRRYVLLRVALVSFAVITAVSSLINLKRGLAFISLVEAAAFILTLTLIHLLRRPGLLSLINLFFVFMVFSVCLILSWYPKTHPTVFIWNTAPPILAFFLWGKRLAMPISLTFLALATFLFLWNHLPGPNVLPPIVFFNVLFFMISVFFLSLYYETTRSETEKALIQDISERQKAEKEKERLITNLEEALAQIKALSGLLPICSSCKRIRDDHGNWNQMESYIQKHSEAQFSHSICPDCAEKIYPELYERS